MARPRKPANVIEMAGKTHLSKADLEKRKNSEVKAEADNVHPPGYLNDEQATAFERIANELLRIGILSNLDCDALARYIQSSTRMARASWDAFDSEGDRHRRMFAPSREDIAAIAMSVMPRKL